MKLYHKIASRDSSRLCAMQFARSWKTPIVHHVQLDLG